MDTAPPLPLLLAELTSDAMSELPKTARLLWILLSAMPTAEPVRLNIPRLRLNLSAVFDHDATRDDVELAVLTLEERGLIATSAGPDGRERFRIAQRPRTPHQPREEPPTAPQAPPTAAPQDGYSPFIETVGRERESESERAERETPPPRPVLTPPPPPFCPDHMPLGSGGIPCVVCADHTRAMKHWDQNRIHAAEWADQPRPQSPTPPAWQRGRRTPGTDDQTPLFGRQPRFHPTGEPEPEPDPDDPYTYLPY